VATGSVGTKKTARRRLGRGLGSLISQSAEVPVATEMVDESAAAGSESALGEHGVGGQAEDGLDIRHVPVGQVVANPVQPRKDFSEDSLQVLAASIERSGLMQPIVVRPAGEGRYEIIAGERRWRAAVMLSLKTIPSLVRDVDDQAAAELSLVENLQRQDLNAVERAEAFRRLVEEFSQTHQEISEAVGMSRTAVSNYLRLNELGESIKAMIRDGVLEMGHGRALLGIEDPLVREEVARSAKDGRWSVRVLEQHVRRRVSGSDGTPRAAASRSQIHVRDLGEQLARHLGTKVSIRPGRKKGTGSVTISFYSAGEFEGLMDRLDFKAQ